MGVVTLGHGIQTGLGGLDPGIQAPDAPEAFQERLHRLGPRVLRQGLQQAQTLGGFMEGFGFHP